MSYRRRMELLNERRMRRAMDERCDQEMYYSHRLKLSEDILSRYFKTPVSLVVKNGWVRFRGKNYRVPEIERYAIEKDAAMQEHCHDEE